MTFVLGPLVSLVDAYGVERIVRVGDVEAYCNVGLLQLRQATKAQRCKDELSIDVGPYAARLANALTRSTFVRHANRLFEAAYWVGRSIEARASVRPDRRIP